ncbi:contactin-4-like [Mercenaria mercenaria]|uniref:contactin-4-like n=1 Tax=Mercenaria mercenaria TaxID=6596 RepID=UPI00234E679E|nr:contactin-4-like [Mercenaria mercenaria]
MKFTAVILLTDIFITAEGWPCLTPVREVYSQINTAAVLQFTADLTNLNSPRTFFVKFHDGTVRAMIRYNADKSYTTDSQPGVSITANTAGIVAVTFESVQKNSAGIYTFGSAGFSFRCNCLYILGEPTKPNITLKYVPFVRDSTTLTCSSTSTTTPSNHSLSLTYNWRVDKEDNPGGSRYSYSSSKKTLTLSNIVKNDTYKQITCKAKEVVTDGYASIRSDSFSFDVLYGPDTANINVQSPYNMTEGDTNVSIECSSDCNPGCSYTWTNLTSYSRISTNGVLFLDTVNRYMTGDYKCTSSNTGIQNKSSETTISTIVNYQTAVTSFYIAHEGQTLVTVNEHDVHIRITCEVDSNPASTIKITFDGEILQEQTNIMALSYTLNDVTCLQAGVYTCEGYNEYGQPSIMNATLFVRCSPRPLHQFKRNITSTLHTPVTLSFTTLAYPEPGPSGFSWHKEDGVRWTPLMSNADLKISSSGLQTNLTLLNVSQSNYGQYRVTVVNGLGSFEQYMYLKPEDIHMQSQTLNNRGSTVPNHTNRGSTVPNQTQGINNTETDNTAMIVGVTLGIFSTVVVVYAIYLTILMRRKSTDKGTFKNLLRKKTHPSGRKYFSPQRISLLRSGYRTYFD